MPLPSVRDLEHLTSTLLGKRVKMKPAAAMMPAQSRSTATYVQHTGGVLFAITADIAFLASVGAALALMPPSAVTEAVKSGKPSDLLVENAYEVFNVTASLFNELEGGHHVKLARLAIGAVDAELAPRLAKPAARLDLDVNVQGYADGKICVMALTAA